MASIFKNGCACSQEELVAAVVEGGFEAKIVTDSRSDLVTLQVLSVLINL